mgnify:CR=1 FL=1
MEDVPKTTGTDHRAFRPKKMTLEDIKNGCISLYGANDNEVQICAMNEECAKDLMCFLQ